MSDLKNKYSLNTATYIVISNMVGTGIFTSLYFQVQPLPSATAIMVLWVFGGIVALSGGLAYAELSGMFPRSGGEYEYLSKIFHPSLGFATGICTLVVGFAAPMASSAINLGNYMAPILNIKEDSFYTKIIALLSVVLVSLVQLTGVKSGSKFHNISTIFKLGLIVFFIILPFVYKSYVPSNTSFSLNSNDGDAIFSGNFFSCLALLYFAYTGWNSSVYISSEVENPKRNIPFSILVGVILVTLLYLLLNFAFLFVCSFEEITQGGSSVGNTVALKMFGERTIAGIKIIHIFSMLFSLALIATINGYMVTAPRVADVMGKDFGVFSFFSKRFSNGSPYLATIIIALMTLIFIFLSNLKSLLDYIGFALAIFASLAVLGVFIMRVMHPNIERPFKTWGYPITPLIFLIVNIAMIYYSVNVLYDGNFIYSIAENGNLLISPLSASILTILGSILLYFVFKGKLGNEEKFEKK